MDAAVHAAAAITNLWVLSKHHPTRVANGEMREESAPGPECRPQRDQCGLRSVAGAD